MFAGRSTRPQDYYSASDLFVFPSRYEAFSLVTIEAMASGLPVLALPINGTEELIQNGENGFFVDRSTESLREKIEQLQKDKRLLINMSEVALETSMRYAWDRIASEQLNAFEMIMNCH